ncbi:putative tyrosyl-DNA phosphodiesterase [Cyphellophora attinorum]|uniref:Putative tyrosyl-DNA phosphodiesterase n=1 Tax=Cyphellophora attinorum TaxID=1664694 RepID=A0A0N1P2P2_9EURO|nr:putative tyrosyl-DNA phosphodiesterase [Phialophora attinorum]KPI44002.1 putative tyrosyl-DNA phosphodiesterase [Phialophora attinorum]
MGIQDAGLWVTLTRVSPNAAVTDRLQHMPPAANTSSAHCKRSTAQPTNTSIMLNTQQLQLPPIQLTDMSSYCSPSVGTGVERTPPPMSTVDGSDPKQISRMLQRSETSVKSKLTRLGLPYTIGARPRESAFSVKKILNAGNLRTLEQRQRDRIAAWSRGIKPPAPARSQSSDSSQISSASTLVTESEAASDASSATTVVASEPVSPKNVGDKASPVSELPATPAAQPIRAMTPSLITRMNANAAAFNFNADPKAFPTPGLSTKVSPAPFVSNYTPQSPVFDDAPMSPPRLGRLPSYTRAFMSRSASPGQAQDLPASARVYGKDQKLDDGLTPDPAKVRQQRASFLASMSRGISPPRSARTTPVPVGPGNLVDDVKNSSNQQLNQIQPISSDRSAPATPQRVVASPFQLTKIRDLPASSNVDTVDLHEILGSPLIKEAWIFNFCFDIDWMMQHFDADVRSMVRVKVIHGSWKREDGNRMGVEDACTRWKNVEAATAYLPDPFGTHHSKMFVLFSHDDTAEVIIHTANMLEKDWTNMTQAVWRSGPLPQATGDAVLRAEGLEPIGSGERFKYDLLEYLKAYKRPTQSLVKQLQQHDFGTVRGALVASVPCKLASKVLASTKDLHLWGHPQLREVITHVNGLKKNRSSPTTPPHLVAQVSSIASLPAGWLANLYSAFRAGAPVSTGLTSNTMSLIYPTAPNVAQSLDGYAAGGSIHTKAHSATHLRQIESLRPHLCQWTASRDGVSADRASAAPHIKTYVQFDRKPTKDAVQRNEVSIDWALTTSANLSTQAWGSLPKSETGTKSKPKGAPGAAEIVQIQSFEIGVLVWPELYDNPPVELDASEKNGATVRMAPVFGKDMPDQGKGRTLNGVADVVVGLRMPYDLPLTPYGTGELPWSPGGTYLEPDSHGIAWANLTQ